MIPNPEKENSSQSLREIVNEALMVYENPPFLPTGEGEMALSDELYEAFDGVLRSSVMMMLSEWYNDMEYMKLRAKDHHFHYDRAVFSTLFLKPDGTYEVRIFPVEYSDLLRQDDRLTVKEFFELLDPEYLAYDVELFQDENTKKALRGLLRSLMTS